MYVIAVMKMVCMVSALWFIAMCYSLLLLKHSIAWLSITRTEYTGRSLYFHIIKQGKCKIWLACIFTVTSYRSDDVVMVNSHNRALVQPARPRTAQPASAISRSGAVPVEAGAVDITEASEFALFYPPSQEHNASFHVRVWQ